MAKRRTNNATEPDAWHRLVLRTMGAEELAREAENTENSAQERQWMRDELAARRKGGAR